MTGKRRMPQASYASVWDAIADTPEEAANLRVRAELMGKIAALIGERLDAGRGRRALRGDAIAYQRPAAGRISRF